jgi:hypothetical protein
MALAWHTALDSFLTARHLDCTQICIARTHATQNDVALSHASHGFVQSDATQHKPFATPLCPTAVGGKQKSSDHFPPDDRMIG